LHTDAAVLISKLGLNDSSARSSITPFEYFHS